MSDIKLNQNKLFPSTNKGIETVFNTNNAFDNSFLEEDPILPAMNVTEYNDGFDIEFAVPGFSKKDFKVSIENNILNVIGEQKEEYEDNSTNKDYNYSFFKKSLKLPNIVCTDQNVKTTYKNGILKLNLFKKQS